MPIGFPRGHEGSAFGAALVGMEALGVVESIGIAADIVRIEDVVEPDEDEAATYARVLPTFAGLYDALEPAFRALQTLAEHEAPGDASGEESS
jgi:gluconokinase